MVAFMEPLRRRFMFKVEGTRKEANYRHLYRFDEDNVTWMAEYWLVDTGATRGGACSVEFRLN